MVKQLTEGVNLLSTAFQFNRQNQLLDLVHDIKKEVKIKDNALRDLVFGELKNII